MISQAKYKDMSFNQIDALRYHYHTYEIRITRAERQHSERQLLPDKILDKKKKAETNTRIQ